MKILTITSHVSSNALPCFQRNKTGFGYMVYDIISAFAENNDVDVLVYYYRYKNLTLNNAHYIGNSYCKILSNIFSCLPVLYLISHLCRYPVSKGAVARVVYCWLLTGYYKTIIKKGKYDVVHIHGCSIYNELWIQVCKKQKQKYVVTLHGLNSFSESIKISAIEKRYEKDFLHDVVLNKHHITVISTGIKNKILKHENVTQSDNISVVCNSFDFGEFDSNTYDIRARYGIPNDAIIVLYIGNISLNKNQRQMVDSFPLLNSNIREKTYVLFIGRPGSGEDDILELIKFSPFKDHLICCGEVDKFYVPFYYKEASAVVLLSISEGFGLSLVEGMSFGVPCMAFTDLDAFEDIYNPCAMVGIPSRTNHDVAKALENLLGKDWNKDEIEQYSKKFNRKTMVSNYMMVFRKINEQL